MPRDDIYRIYDKEFVTRVTHRAAAGAGARVELNACTAVEQFVATGKPTLMLMMLMLWHWSAARERSSDSCRCKAFDSLVRGCFRGRVVWQ